MSYAVVWEVEATSAATRFLKDDPTGLSQVINAVDRLADQPYPPDSAALGSLGLRRLHCGRYRVLYEVLEGEITIVVMHLGRVG